MIYDINGVNPEGLSYDNFSYEELFVIFKPNQTITLRYPAYVNYSAPDGTTHNLTVQKLVMAGNGSVTAEDISTGWEVVSPDDDAEVAAVVEQLRAEMLTVPNVPDDFNPDFATKIKFTSLVPSTSAPQVKIKIKYQRPRMERKSNYEEIDGIGPKYSPSLMLDTLNRISRLERSTISGSLFGTELDVNDILEEDRTGIAPENFVRYERHEVNTANSINFIQPSRGSFYADGLTVHMFDEVEVTLKESNVSRYIEDGIRYLFIYSDVSVVSSNRSHISTTRRIILSNRDEARELIAALGGSATGTLASMGSDASFNRLTPGVDYVITDVDIGRTAMTVNTSGVYRGIKFINQTAGVVFVSYHAFGGTANARDLRILHQEVTNARAILAEGGLITEDTLKDQLYLIGLNKRITKIESFHNFNCQVEHNISIDSAGFHWINVAQIYPTAYSGDEINDIGQFRVASALRRWNYEFIIDVDMERPNKSQVMMIRTIGTNQRSGSSVDDIARVVDHDTVAARLCWVKSGSDNGKASGIILQIGWNFDRYKEDEYTVSNDTITVTNKSGAGSSWELVTDPEQLNFTSDGLIAVYYHNTYKATDDESVVAGRRYYKYDDQYVYTKTIDRTASGSKKYYEQQSNYTYVESSIVASVNIQQYCVEHGLSALFERRLVAKAIKEETPPLGTNPKTAGYLVMTSGTYDQDTEFSMPNVGMKWTAGSAGSECVLKFLDPDDGVLVWNGSISLAQFAPKAGYMCPDCTGSTAANPASAAGSTFESQVCLDKYLQKELDLRAIRAMTVVFYDRVRDTYPVVHVPVVTKETSAEASVPFCYEDDCYSIVRLNKMTRSDIIVESYDGTKMNTALTSGTYIKLAMEVFMGTFSQVNDRFDLRQIKIHS